jgi:hypothetical protein
LQPALLECQADDAKRRFTNTLTCKDDFFANAQCFEAVIPDLAAGSSKSDLRA